MSEVKTMNTKENKITAEQLEKVTSLQTELQKYCASIGGMEVQKAKAIYQVNMLENEMDEFKKSIEKEYGPINIDLSHGNYEVIESKEKE